MTHLSRQRKRNLNEIPIVAASEVGIAQTSDSIIGVVGPVITSVNLSRIFWKVEQYRVIAPYAKRRADKIGT